MIVSLKHMKLKLEVWYNWLSCGSCNILGLPEIDYITSIYGEKKARYWNKCKDKHGT